MLFVHSILLSTQENSTEGTDKPLLRGGGAHCFMQWQEQGQWKLGRQK